MNTENKLCGTSNCVSRAVELTEKQGVDFSALASENKVDKDEPIVPPNRTVETPPLPQSAETESLMECSQTNLNLLQDELKHTKCTSQDNELTQELMFEVSEEHGRKYGLPHQSENNFYMHIAPSTLNNENGYDILRDYKKTTTLNLEPASAKKCPQQNLSLSGFCITSEVLSLRQFIKQFQRKLPVIVHIHSGSFEGTKDTEFLRVECVALSKVVTGIYNEQEFCIPINTGMKFAILYGSDKGGLSSIDGVRFEGVASLLATDPMPKVICSRNRWDHKKGSVRIDEILIVRQAVVKKDKRKGIKVFSMNTRTEKYLSSKCPVVFTTQAHRIALHLPDIMAYVPNPFPCSVCIRKDDGSPKCYINDIIQLTNVSMKPVLKCSSLNVPEHENLQPTIFHIPATLPDIEVEVLEADDLLVEKSLRHIAPPNGTWTPPVGRKSWHPSSSHALSVCIN